VHIAAEEARGKLPEHALQVGHGGAGLDEQPLHLVKHRIVRGVGRVGPIDTPQRYDPQRPFLAWLYTIARNYCFMQLRNKMHPLPEDAIEKNGNVLHQELFEETLGRIKEKEKILEYLEDALQHLQTNQRECLSLFYLEKLSYRQIGEKTGLSLLQIKSYIQNGKRNMRLMIEKKMKEDAS
jgi:RNA polymerase sigma factor (sigma-70 family)